MAAIMSWESHVVAMIDVERALAGALGAAGLVDSRDAAAAEEACDPARVDLERLRVATAEAATPVIPLVTALVKSAGTPGAATALHRGATSQDIIDTGMALQLRAALDRLEELLMRAADRCAELAERHANDVMAGRTLGQQAVPITFGLKAARWLAAIDRRIIRLRQVRDEQLTVQLGGAAGTGGALGVQGPFVVRELARRLELGVSPIPRHSERDHVADLAGAIGSTAGVADKIAHDLILLAQSEIGEISFASDGATSSAMPHKRNAVDAVAARAAARLAASEAAGIATATGDHELERAAGAWQAEWVAVPSLLNRTAGALLRVGEALNKARPDVARMKENITLGLDLTSSEALALALTPHLGREEAGRVISNLATAAAVGRRSLSDVAVEDGRVITAIGVDAARAATDAKAALAMVPDLIANVVQDHRALR